MFDHLSYTIVNEDNVSDVDLNFTKLFELLEITDTPKRRKSYLISRLALQKELYKRKICLNLDNLILMRHKFVHGYPMIRCSLSHTKNTAIALTGHTKNYLSIGVDIEFKNRSIKKGSSKYFINLKDSFKQKSDLKKWVIKEACYKAVSSLLEKEFLLKDITCLDEKFYFENISGCYKIFEENDLLICMAYVPIL
ncbi:MAG: hypothetical protein N4A33_06845 [Bacteriovoracaceae bacterium]|jgi:phosphopantetheinyl transferase (holo-ACP synthase)|nr:hypothetical protein [Bacteriovoracaceae bacterium]